MANRGTITEDQIAATSKEGDGDTLQTYAGASAPVAGNVPAFDASGALVDSLAPPLTITVNGVPIV